MNEVKTIPSLSVSSWEELMIVGQLSFVFWWPSPSLRKEQTVKQTVPQTDSAADSTCLCCHHRYLPQDHHLSQTAGRQNKQLCQSYGSRWDCGLVYDLVWVGHVRTAVTGVSHSVIVSVLLVWVGDSLAVVKNIFQTWEHKVLSSLPCDGKIKL